MTLEEALRALQPPPGHNTILSKEAIDVVCNAARFAGHAMTAPQTNQPTPADVEAIECALGYYEEGEREGTLTKYERAALFALRRLSATPPAPAVKSAPGYKPGLTYADGYVNGIKTAARIALDGCLVPPDGGSPTKAEREMCEDIADAIMARADGYGRPPIPPAPAVAQEEQIKHMTNRFLGWRLPKDFNPDAGISYTRPNYDPSIDATPSGTNLFTAAQAEAMVRYMVEGSLTPAMRDVVAERHRQVFVEGWTPEHDDQHRDGELAGAGACYAVHDATYIPERPARPAPYAAVAKAAKEARAESGLFRRALALRNKRAGQPDVPAWWPWMDWWKPKDRRSNLVRAAALIIADIERLDRAVEDQQP